MPPKDKAKAGGTHSKGQMGHLARLQAIKMQASKKQAEEDRKLRKRPAAAADITGEDDDDTRDKNKSVAFNAF